MTEPTPRQPGQHAFQHVMHKIRDGRLYQEKLWANGEMVVLMPDPSTNLRIRHNEKAARFAVEPVDASAEHIRTRLDTFEIAPEEDGYREEDLGDLLKAVRNMHCNQQREQSQQPTLPGLAGASARDRGPAGRTAL